MAARAMHVFSDPLTAGRLIKRYKRFLADVALDDGSVVTAHCANSGSMLGCAAPGSRIWLSPNRSKTAKLDWRWELVEADGTLVGINTSRPNAIVARAIADGQIPELAGYDMLKREVRYGHNSRVDIVLEGAGGRAYVEVKNVTLATEGLARFPDAVTARGRKHLEALSACVAQGHRAVMLFLVQRGDCRAFSAAEDIDPTYAQALAHAHRDGVEVLVYDCAVSTHAISVRASLPFQRAPR